MLRSCSCGCRRLLLLEDVPQRVPSPADCERGLHVGCSTVESGEVKHDDDVTQDAGDHIQDPMAAIYPYAAQPGGREERYEGLAGGEGLAGQINGACGTQWGNAVEGAGRLRAGLSCMRDVRGTGAMHLPEHSVQFAHIGNGQVPDRVGARFAVGQLNRHLANAGDTMLGLEEAACGVRADGPARQHHCGGNPRILGVRLPHQCGNGSDKALALPPTQRTSQAVWELQGVECGPRRRERINKPVLAQPRGQDALNPQGCILHLVHEDLRLAGGRQNGVRAVGVHELIPDIVRQVEALPQVGGLQGTPPFGIQPGYPALCDELSIRAGGCEAQGEDMAGPEADDGVWQVNCVGVGKGLMKGVDERTAKCIRSTEAQNWHGGGCVWGAGGEGKNGR